MKKISQISWKRYKDSAEGKAIIAQFEKLHTNESTTDDMLTAARQFNPQAFQNMSKKEEQQLLSLLGIWEDTVGGVLANDKLPENYTFEDFYDDITYNLVIDCFEKEEGYELVQQDYKNILSTNTALSIVLYAYQPSFFVPNFFMMQFIYLKKLAEKYEIELPETPNRADYEARWWYYYALCEAFKNFAEFNEFETPEDFCAFIFGYELPLIKEEVDNNDTSEMPAVPGRAWILVGNYSEGEKTMEYGFWQANPFTSKGDVLLFYEKSPVKALNSVWIAQQDGVVDPFFHYYSNTYIGNKITIPSDQAIKFEDFKASEYFKNREKTGNFVSKNFQDVSGWTVTNEDYREIKRMLEEKGFDTSVLPSLYEPKKIGDVVIEDENDVSEKLLMPMLEEMGWHEHSDYEREVHFNAGRTETGAISDKRPDFCLHMKQKSDGVEAKVIIEVKKFMRNDKEIKENFIQGASYAKWGNAKVLVICDQQQMIIIERNKDFNFDLKKGKKYTWFDRENADKFQEIKELLS